MRATCPANLIRNTALNEHKIGKITSTRFHTADGKEKVSKIVRTKLVFIIDVV